MKLVVNHETVKCFCPLNHFWLTTAKTFDLGLVKKEGRRPRHEFQTIYGINECPTCNLKCCKHIIDFDCSKTVCG